MKILTYVLHGTWNTQDTDGVVVIGVSVDVMPLLRKLDEIADSKAKKYVEMYGYIQEERGERYYEAVNASGKYAKFYITEHQLELPENTMRVISQEMQKIDRARDVKKHLQELDESDSIEFWKYEYMVRNPYVMKEILQLFERMEDCNTPFNTTMDIVVENVMKELTLDDKKLEYLWDEFGNVLVDDDGCILDGFLGFESGTCREEVWHWFDEKHSKGIYALMHIGEGDEE